MPLEDRTEPPTEHRRREARQKGQVSRSVELSSSLAMIAGLAALRFTGPHILEKLREAFRAGLTEWPARDLTPELALRLGMDAVMVSMAILLPILLAGLTVAAVGTAAQVGLVVSGEPLALQLSRLDPVKGIQRLFSRRSIIELGRSFIKILLVGYVIWITLRQESALLASLPGASWDASVQAVGGVIWKVVVRASAVILVIAGFDYLIQRRQHEQELRMTKHELKEELRRTEGDPTTRSRIRQLMREMSMKRMMSDVPKADVVVVNPTSIAVALRYDSRTMSAPKVLAKGQRLIAERIREIAEKHGIPVIRNVTLARALFRSVEVGQEVPLELYQAVAEVLAAVYRMKGRAL